MEAKRLLHEGIVKTCVDHDGPVASEWRIEREDHVFDAEPHVPHRSFRSQKGHDMFVCGYAVELSEFSQSDHGLDLVGLLSHDHHLLFLKFKTALFLQRE